MWKSTVGVIGLLASCLLVLTACGTAPVDAPAPTGTTATTVPSASLTDAPIQLTAEEAKAVALAHAGLEEDAVGNLRADYAIDEMRGMFEVSFQNGDYHYDYDVDAVTGAVISYEREHKRDE